MRLARKMLLLVIATAAIMALIAPLASATNAVRYARADGTYCGTVTVTHPTVSGGCQFHWEGETTLFFHIFGFEGTEFKCHVEIRGRIGTTGEGRITGYHIKQGTHADSSCTESVLPPCSEVVADASHRFPWHFRVEQLANGTTQMHIRACIDPVESGVCQGEQKPLVTETGGAGAEVQTQTATDQTLGGSFCEFTFSLKSEGTVVHQSPGA